MTRALTSNIRPQSLCGILILVASSAQGFHLPWSPKESIVPAASSPETDLSGFLKGIEDSFQSLHWPSSYTPADSTPPPASTTEDQLKSINWWNPWKSKQGNHSVPDTIEIPVTTIQPTPNVEKKNVSEKVQPDLEKKTPVSKHPTKEIRADPRLVPSVIYEMECAPGHAFHQCVQDCTKGQIHATSSRGGTYQEAEYFKQCVTNCTDGLLNSAGPGCLTEDGRLILRHPDGTEKVYGPNTIKVRAWLYRMRHALSIPFGKWFSRVILSLMSVLFWCLLLAGLVKYKVHELLFVTLNGLPNTTRLSENESEQLRLEKMDGYYIQLTSLFGLFEDRWSTISGHIENVACKCLRFSLSVLNTLLSSSNTTDDQHHADNTYTGVVDYREELLLNRLKNVSIHPS